MANSDLSTTFLQSAAENELTAEQNQLITDRLLLPPEVFESKYGSGSFGQTNDQLIASQNYLRDMALAQEAGLFSADSLRNIATGAATGIVDTASFASNIVGLNQLSKYLARGSEKLNNFSDSYASEAERAANRAYEINQRLDEEINARKYQEALKAGKSATEAKWERFRRETLNTLENLYKTNQGYKVVSQGLGSLGTDIALTGGVGLGAKLTAKAIPSVAKAATQAYEKSSPLAKKIADALPWMAATGMQEGGSQYVQTLLEGLDTKISSLRENSPKFNKRVAELVQHSNYTIPEAEEKAREELAFEAAEQAAHETAAFTSAINYFTKGISKPLSRGDKTLAKYIGEGLIEPGEEGVSELAGQFASNRAVKEYLDNTKDITEGLGQSLAEGAVGGMGITGLRSVKETGPIIGKTAELIGKGLEAASDKKLDWEISEKRTSALNDYLSKNETKYLEDVRDLGVDSNKVKEVNASLNSLSKEIFNKESPVSFERSLQILDEVKALEDSLETAIGSNPRTNLDKDTAKLVNTYESRMGNVIFNIKSNILSPLERDIRKVDPSTEQGAAKFAKYLLAVSKSDSVTAAQNIFNSLDKDSKAVVSAVRFTSDNMNEAYLNILSSNNTIKDSVEKSTLVKDNDPVSIIDTEKAISDEGNDTWKDSSLNSKKDSKVDFSEFITKETKENTLKLERIKSEEAKNLPVTDNTGTIKIGDLDLTYSLRDEEGSDTISVENDEFKFDTSNLKDAEKRQASAEELKKAFEQDLLNFYETYMEEFSKFNKDVGEFKVSKNGREIPLRVGHTTFTLGNRTFKFSDSASQIINDPNSSLEDKVKAIQSHFTNESGLVVSSGSINRAYQVLTAEDKTIEEEISAIDEVYDSGEYIYVDEAGELAFGVYDKNEVKSLFDSIFGTEFSNILTPVKRDFHLITQENPIQLIISLLKDRETLLNHLRANNYSNAERLANSLFYDRNTRKRFTGKVEPKDVVNPGDPVAVQLVTLLSEGSQFRQAIDKELPNFVKQLNKDNALYKAMVKDGEATPQLRDLITLCAAHSVSMTSVSSRADIDEAIKRRGFDPTIQDEEFYLRSGVLSWIATQNLATTFRKFMGVARSNNSTRKQYRELLGEFSSLTLGLMKDAGIIKVEQSPIKVKSWVEGIGYKEVQSNEPIYRILPGEGYEAIFRPKANALEAIIDPDTKNTLHFEPIPDSKTRRTFNHDFSPVSNEMEEVIALHNKEPKRISQRFVNFVMNLGGIDEYFKYINGGILPDGSNDHLNSVAYNDTLKGQLITYRMAWDALVEVMASLEEGQTLDDVELYWDHVATRNARIMQVGAVTTQGNKVMREIATPFNGNIDLTDKRINRNWKTILAQKLGESLNRSNFNVEGNTLKVANSSYEAKVNKVLDKIEKDLNESSPYSGMLKNLGKPNSRINMQALLDYKRELNSAISDLGYKLEGPEADQTLMEIVRYFEVKNEGNLKDFDSYLFLEIDGTNDGPSYINALFAFTSGSPIPEYFENLAKTGTIPLIKATSQKVLTDPDHFNTFGIANRQGTKGQNLHEQVSEEEILAELYNHLKYIRGLKLANSRADNALYKQTELALNAAKALLRLFKAIGWISEGSVQDIDDFVDGKVTLEKSPIKFKKDISKKLVTILPYGSSALGASRQIAGLDMYHNGFQKVLTEQIREVAGITTNEALFREVRSFLDATSNAHPYVIVDTETAGIKDDIKSATDISKAKIAQISIRRFENGKETSKTFFFNLPEGYELPPEIDGKLNPLIETYKNASKVELQDSEVIKEIQALFDGASLIGHNIDLFDIPVISNNFGINIQNSSYDTLYLSKALIKGEASYKLEKLAKNKGYESESGKAHDADEDTLMTSFLIDLLKKEGEKYLQDNKEPSEKTEEKQPTFNGLSWDELKAALKTLFSTRYTPANDKSDSFELIDDSEIESLITHLDAKFATTNELKNKHFKFDNYKGELFTIDKNQKNYNWVHNVQVTTEGENHLANIVYGIFGKAAYDAVTKAMSEEGMKGSKTPMGTMSLQNSVARVVESDLLYSKDLDNLTAKEEFQELLKIRRTQALVDLDGGPRILAEKQKLIEEQKPAYTNKKNPEFNYFPPINRLGSIGVAGGAIFVQAMGDVVTVLNSFKKLKKLGINLNQVYDGDYVSAKDAQAASKIFNAAVRIALMQKPIACLHNAMLKTGKAVKEIYPNLQGLSNEEAFTQVLVNAAKNQYPNGRKVPNSEEEIFKEIIRDVESAFKLLGIIPTNTPNILSPEVKQGSTFANLGKAKASVVKSNFDKVWDKLDFYRKNENVIHSILNEIPTSYHHMAATDDLDSIYTEGNVKELSEVKPLLDEARTLMSDPEMTLSKFLSIYVRSRMIDKFKELYKIVDKVTAGKEGSQTTQEYFDSWKQQLGLAEGIEKSTEGNSKKEIFPEYFVEKITKSFDGKKTTKKISHVRNKINKTKIFLGKTGISKAFRNIKYGKSSLVSTILGKVQSMLPKEDVNIILYATKEDLLNDKNVPKEIKEKIKLNGVFGTASVASSTIYMVSTDPENLSISSGRNSEILVHELIHLAIGPMILNYYGSKGNKLTEGQKTAIKNLENLLEELPKLGLDDKPIIVRGLEQLLADFDKQISEAKDEIVVKTLKAAKLDESLAYILSNEDLIASLSDLDVSEELKHQTTNSIKVYFSNLIKAARHIWKTFFKIIAGSRADEIFTSKKALGKEKNLPENVNKAFEEAKFLTLYGANTLILLNDETLNRSTPRDTTKDPEKELKTRNIERSNELIKAFANKTYIATYKDLSLDASRMMSSDSDLIKGTVERIAMTRLFKLRGKGLEKFWKTLVYKADSLNLVQSTQNEIDAEFKKLNDYIAIVSDNLKNYIPNAGNVALSAVIFQDPNAFTPAQRKELTDIYNSFIENLKEDFLVNSSNPTKEELEKSKQIYNLLLGKDKNFLNKIGVPLDPKLVREGFPKSFVENFENQAIFLSLVENVPEIKEHLGKIKLNPVYNKHQKTGWDISRKLEQWVLRTAEKQKLKKFNDKDLTDVINQFTAERDDLIKSSQDQSIRATAALQTHVDNAFISALLSPLMLLKNQKGQTFIKNVKDLHKDPLEARTQIAETMRMLNNRFSNTFVAGVIKDLYARVPSNTEFETQQKELKGFEDRVRMANLEQIPELLSKEFKHHKIDKKMLKFLDRTVGQTDLSCIGNTEAKLYSTDANARQKRIAEIENNLKDSSYQKYVNNWLLKSKQLAEYLSGSRKAGNKLFKNAVAIANLGAEEGILLDVDVDTIKLINELVTLYCLENITSEGDVNLLTSLFSKDEEAMNTLLQEIRSIKKKEYSRVKEEKGWKYNHIKGWRPNGAHLTGHYILVKKSEYTKFNGLGYDYLGEYEASNLDKSEKYIRMWNPAPHNREVQEGLIQCIHQTAFGWQIQNYTSGEAAGSKFEDSNNMIYMRDNLNKESSGNNVIPIISDSGVIIGFERSIPPEDREKIEQDRDLFSGLAQYKMRQHRENIATEVNKNVVLTAHQHWLDASPSAKRQEFIDVFNSNNPAIKLAVSRFDSRTRKLIKDTFGGEHFYLRKDEVWSVIGYYRLSLTDMWDNQFILPKTLEDCITKCIDALFKNGRGRIYTGRLESVLMSISSFARNTIVIRSVIVPMINCISNILLLNFALGIPPKDIYRLYKETSINTEEYNQKFHKLIKLQFKIDTATDQATKNRYQAEYDRIQASIEALPEYNLIIQGEYSTISPEGVTTGDYEYGRQAMENWIDNLADKHLHGQLLKKAASNLFLTRGSDTYAFLAKFTNYGDWLAKAVAYRYLTEPGGKFKGRSEVMLPEEARNVASLLFVDYDQFVDRERDYINRIGAAWFMTYKFRMIAALPLAMLLNPSRMILGTLFEGFMDFGGTPLSDNLITKILTGQVSFSVGWDMLWRGILMHPWAIFIRELA